MRILYAYPSYFTEELVEEIATNPKVRERGDEGQRGGGGEGGRDHPSREVGGKGVVGGGRGRRCSTWAPPSPRTWPPPPPPPSGVQVPGHASTAHQQHDAARHEPAAPGAHPEAAGSAQGAHSTPRPAHHLHLGLPRGGGRAAQGAGAGVNTMKCGVGGRAAQGAGAGMNTMKCGVCLPCE